ncbi:hypothetical protein H0H93_000184 [Arthromyces matolae]|nr:hypothetical protein H0H93_000184 [Arthromyces matolae]
MATNLPSEKHIMDIEQKIDSKREDVESVEFEDSHASEFVLENERDIATRVISVEDDPSLNPWTIRAFVIGIGLSAFGGVLGTAAATSALGTEVLAVQRLFYNITPNPAASIFLLFSSQLLGYGIGGLLRSVLLYPSKMLYPGVLPLVSMLDVLFKEPEKVEKKLRLFKIVFGVIFIWELFPEWMFPLLTGFSIFCLADQRSQDFTRIFGGSNGNEGLGLLSICFDWQYISGGYNPMTIPLKAQFSNLIGYILCMVVFVAVYYNNIWQSRNLPFLSQELFYANGTVYDQLRILNDKFEVDPELLQKEGLPFYAGSWVVQLLTTNLGMAATFTHLLLWNRHDMRNAWTWMKPSELKRIWSNFDIRFWMWGANQDGEQKFFSSSKISGPLTNTTGNYDRSPKRPNTSNHIQESDWEDVEDVENQSLQSNQSLSGSVRVGMSSPHRRKVVQRTTYIASPARKPLSAPPTPTKSKKPPRKYTGREEVFQGARQGASFTFSYILDIFCTAIRLLRRPLGLLLFLWLLATLVNRLSITLRTTLSPLCLLPGLYGSRFCEAPAPTTPGANEPPRWADYPKFIDAQSATFEHLLDDSVGGSAISLEIKKAEMATSDLITLVQISDLKSRETLSEHLSTFVEEAKKTGRDLQRLSSKIGGAVDNIMAVNDYALHQIESVHAKPPGVLSLYGVIPWAAQKPTYDVVIRTFDEAMGVLSTSLERLILEAEVNLANLERLEERLSTLHDIVSREDVTISNAKSELLAELWTILGGNRGKLRNFDSHLVLLKNLSSYRKKALAHVVAALQTLKGMSHDMEDIRERVAAPELLGPRIPIEVHIKSIKTGPLSLPQDIWHGRPTAGSQRYVPFRKGV